ncbi:MAG: hypothetical protein CML16_00155 [Pusillimonas sp.]|nr:hypothetical protein [Pusillimonas sp.]
MPSTASDSEIKRFSLEVGDIMFTKDSESFDDIANSAVVIEELKDIICGYHLAHVRADRKYLVPNYLSKLFHSIDYNYWFQINATGITRVGLGLSSIRDSLTLLPPISEQTQIATYLDTKTKVIDKKIKLLKRKTKHYKAYRKTLINEVATKGLDNDISTWTVKRLKDIGFLYSGLSGKSGNDFNQESNPNNKGFIPFTNIANNTYLDKNHLGTVVIDEKENQNQVKKNDIFFLMSSEGYEDIGKSALLRDDIEETYLNSFCKGFRITNKNCYASFINYLLLCDNYRQKMLIEGKGFTRINLKMEKVNNFSITIPPTKNEQQKIADYLDAKTATIDSILKNIETQINTLKELRKTLINEVVTGKVKVSSDLQ